MGLVYIKKVSETARLGLWEITEAEDILRQQLTLTGEEETVLANKRSERKKKEWLATRNLLQTMFPQNAGLSYDAHGKPYLVNNEAHISISHSAGYAVVYIDSIKPVGIDIQKLKPDISKGVAFYMNETELSYFEITDNILLHIVWSVKEAVFKYLGDPELNFKEDVTLLPFARNQSGTIQVNILHYSQKQSIRVEYEEFGDYILTRTL